MSTLAHAIDFLGAVEVAPWRYAFQWDEPGPWFTTSARSLEKFATMALYHDGDDTGWLLRKGLDLSIFFRELCRKMPDWWEPEQREAWRCKGIFRLHDAHVDRRPYCKNAQRVTADLETGAEVPA